MNIADSRQTSRFLRLSRHGPDFFGTVYDRCSLPFGALDSTISIIRIPINFSSDHMKWGPLRHISRFHISSREHSTE